MYGIVDCGSLLWHLQNTALFSLFGSAYYHPVLPLIPPQDWAEQLQRWQGLGGHLFRRSFTGFWPPGDGLHVPSSSHCWRGRATATSWWTATMSSRSAR